MIFCFHSFQRSDSLRRYMDESYKSTQTQLFGMQTLVQLSL